MFNWKNHQMVHHTYRIKAESIQNLADTTFYFKNVTSSEDSDSSILYTRKIFLYYFCHFGENKNLILITRKIEFLVKNYIICQLFVKILPENFI